MTDSQASENSLVKLRKLAARAAEDKQVVFRSLAHLVDLDALAAAHQRIRKDGAPGVDGQTAEEYAQDLRGNLERLLARLKAGEYMPPPVRRAHIPKADGKKRPIGIPAYEDKIVQRAYATVLEAIYEKDFEDFSYGFRPGRGCHQALQALWQSCMDHSVCVVLDADIQGFFDTLNHEQLLEFIGRRVGDRAVRRMVRRWLEAGVMEEGKLTHPEAGTPQGGVISPLLANVYLHYVLDEWFRQEVVPRLRGRAFLIRYADDFVIGFEQEADAQRVLAVLPKRFGKHHLTLHPEKTRLVPFARPRERATDGDTGTGPQPGTFDFLGFTHLWRRARSGRYAVARQTAGKRLTRSLTALRTWCRDNRHRPVAEQHRALSAKLRGHYAYYGITGNYARLHEVWYETRRVWRQWLSRRSQRARMTWERFKALLERHPLPRPRVVHSVYALANGK